MMKNYVTTRALAKGKKPKDDSSRKVAVAFLKEKVVMSMYGGPTPYEPRRKLKVTSQPINVVSLATLEYHHWSESPITFVRMDHPDSIPKLGWFLLIVDLLVMMTQLTKALMDGNSGFNLMYLDTFDMLRFTWDQLQSNPHPLYGVVPGKQSIPLGRVTLPDTFRDASNYYTEMLMFKVVDFSRPYHIILGKSCYVKFMAITSNAHLKLKIPGPARVITVDAKAQ
jgi:hypothetical protein